MSARRLTAEEIGLAGRELFSGYGGTFERIERASRLFREFAAILDPDTDLMSGRNGTLQRLVRDRYAALLAREGRTLSAARAAEILWCDLRLCDIEQEVELHDRFDLAAWLERAVVGGPS